MARSQVILTCDCGCGKKAQPHETELWLTLTQNTERNRSAEPKLGYEGDSRSLEFASIGCLAAWSKGAVKIIPGMVKSASGLHPRGGYYSSEFPTLWF